MANQLRPAFFFILAFGFLAPGVSAKEWSADASEQLSVPVMQARSFAKQPSPTPKTWWRRPNVCRLVSFESFEETGFIATLPNGKTLTRSPRGWISYGKIELKTPTARHEAYSDAGFIPVVYQGLTSKDTEILNIDGVPTVVWWGPSMVWFWTRDSHDRQATAGCDLEINLKTRVASFHEELAEKDGLRHMTWGVDGTRLVRELDRTDRSTTAWIIRPNGTTEPLPASSDEFWVSEHFKNTGVLNAFKTAP